MRVAIGILVLCLGVMAIAVGASSVRNEAQAQTPQIIGISASNGLIALSDERDDTHQQVTLVDPQKQTMAVYHIDRASGKVTLKCVRNVRWDLLLDEFNGANPAPREIRALVGQ